MNETEYLKNKLEVTKIDAAKRQLSEAIRMFFEMRDPVSIHTLCGASLGILDEIARSKNISRPIKDNPLIREERRRDWINALNASKNFFKHAKSDTTETHEFHAEANVFSLFEAIHLYQILTNSTPGEFYIFLVWLFLNYSSFFTDNAVKKKLLEEVSKRKMNTNNFEVLTEILCQASKYDNLFPANGISF